MFIYLPETQENTRVVVLSATVKRLPARFRRCKNIILRLKFFICFFSFYQKITKISSCLSIPERREKRRKGPFPRTVQNDASRFSTVTVSITFTINATILATRPRCRRNHNELAAPAAKKSVHQSTHKKPDVIKQQPQAYKADYPKLSQPRVLQLFKTQKIYFTVG